MITHQRVIVFAWMLSMLLLCGETFPSFAEQMKTDESRADFLKALRPRPHLPARTKGLQTKGMPVSKGPAQVVADYETLITQPLARALILFQLNSDLVLPQSYPLLKNLADVLAHDLPDAKIIIAGHTDSTGTAEYNQGLSKRRAQAVKNVLVKEYRIAHDRLDLQWYGENHPYTSNATSAGRAQNRRVEFIRIE